MKIAVATTDGTQVSPHFGRSAGFVIYDLEGTVVKHRQLRANHHTPHAQGRCEGNHEHAHGHSGHNHSEIVQLLGDCEVVLCGGIGAGAANALQAGGIRALMLPTPCAADDALKLYLNGDIPADGGRHACGCHSH